MVNFIIIWTLWEGFSTPIIQIPLILQADLEGFPPTRRLSCNAYWRSVYLFLEFTINRLEQGGHTSPRRLCGEGGGAPVDRMKTLFESDGVGFDGGDIFMGVVIDSVIVAYALFLVLLISGWLN